MKLKSGIIYTLKKILLRSWYVFAHRLDTRITVMIGLTYFCQCNCTHCGMGNYPKDKKEELGKTEIIEIIKGFSRRKIRTIHFFGGEPLLRNDIFDLINYAHKRGFITKIETNGFLLNREVVKKLKNSGLNLIGVSIDSPYPQIHDNLRGAEGLFNTAITGIKNCLEEKIWCYISTYATKENLKNGDLKKIISLGKELKVIAVRIISPLAVGRWSGRKNIQLNYREQELLNKVCQDDLAWLEDKHCTAMAKKRFYISPYGDIQPCPYVPLNFGNLRKEPLENILKRMWGHPVFKIKTKNECLINNTLFQQGYLPQITSANPLLDIKK